LILSENYDDVFDFRPNSTALGQQLHAAVGAISVQGSHASWNCVCEVSRTWKVLKNEFGSGKSWKSKFKALQFAGQ